MKKNIKKFNKCGVGYLEKQLKPTYCCSLSVLLIPRKRKNKLCPMKFMKLMISGSCGTRAWVDLIGMRNSEEKLEVIRDPAI
jgi:hypothetical protein